MSGDMDRSMRKMIREELGQLLDDILTNIEYVRSGEHDVLDWERAKEIVRETRKDLDRKIDRMERP